ncbi:MAG TPA: 1,4-dihydroxy-6-naphthoate synthase [Anaeromyxobacteraceae bacterium]|nr:1,4-dihydroxy-6-naphthoate synthase [Anaeromyxobacteraceae bacterium]
MTGRTLALGFSPCPNDTFIFDALVNGRVDTGALRFEPVLEDVETLNRWALQGRLDVTKISYGALPLVAKDYLLLDSGGAMGRGVGPLLVARPDRAALRPETATVAIPGEHTTAHLLFSLAYPEVVRKRFIPFSEIEEAVRGGAVDAGVLIHEGRFTYQAKGLVKLVDLGEHWEAVTGSPIPLGGIVARRSLGAQVAREVDRLIRESVEQALGAYPRITDYVERHAQELDPAVMRRHVELYVNDFSVGMGDAGRSAVRRLIEVHARTWPGGEPLPEEIFLG